MSDRYLPDNEPRDILLSLEELAVKKLPHAPAFRKAADEITRLRADLAAVTAERDALLARLAPVEDKKLVEIAARALRAEVFDPDVLKVYGDLWAYDDQRKILKKARAAIAAIRPHIEAAERERCARIADDCDKSTHPADVAAAIRRGE